MNLEILDHAIRRIIERTESQFDYDNICEQVKILIFQSGCHGHGLEHIKTPYGTLVLEDGTVRTFLDAGQRPKRKIPKRRKI